MASELTVYEVEQAVAVMTASGDYKVRLPLGGVSKTLKRDIDFGVIPGTKSPSLFKAGAEAICLAYGLVPHISLEGKIEEWQKNEKGEAVFFAMYTMKCELHKIASNGEDYAIASGYGSANTFEKRNGFNKGKPDAINSTLKMAQKRAMVGTVLSVSGLSQMFSQDLEDESFMSKAEDVMQSDDDFVKKDKVLNLMALATSKGFTKSMTKKVLAEHGFMNGNAIEIKVKDYERARALFDNGGDE